MLLKYGLGLQTSEKNLEAKHIYIFLLKFDGKIKTTAQRLLASMSNNGSMQPLVPRVNALDFNQLYQLLERKVEIGIRLENLLNRLGQKFTFEFMLAEISYDILELAEEMHSTITEDKEHLANELSNSFAELRKREQSLNVTRFEMEYTMNDLVFYINSQIDMLERHAHQEKVKSIITGILCGFATGPGIPAYGPFMQQASYLGQIEKYLQEANCEELKFFNLLLEFADTFGQLGNDIAQIRTKEDLKDFDFGVIKTFIDADIFAVLQSDDFYVDSACLLGMIFA